MLNTELRGIRAKFGITQKMIAKELEMTPQTYAKKEKEGFDQKEMYTIAEYLKGYDSSLSIISIFFKQYVKKT